MTEIGTKNEALELYPPVSKTEKKTPTKTR